MDPNKTIDKLGAAPLEKLIVKFGGWTISNKTGVWKEDDWSLQKAVENMKEFGIFFSYFVGEDDKNSSQNILQVILNVQTCSFKGKYVFFILPL